MDILFKDVDELHIKTEASGLSIQETESGAEAGRSQSRPLIRFVLKADGWSGFIVAGSVAFHEDQGSYDEPSALFSGLR